MNVENIHPGYENEEERLRTLTETYINLQKHLHNRKKVLVDKVKKKPLKRS